MPDLTAEEIEKRVHQTWDSGIRADKVLAKARETLEAAESSVEFWWKEHKKIKEAQLKRGDDND